MLNYKLKNFDGLYQRQLLRAIAFAFGLILMVMIAPLGAQSDQAQISAE